MICELAENKPDIEKLGVGIIGESPSKTARSPFVWNFVYDKLGWKKKYYSFDLKKENLPDFFKYARENILAFNVAVPYKQEVIKYIDEIDEKAKFIGAVNFVKNTDGCLIGYNSDGEGAISALVSGKEPFLDSFENKRIAIIGAGGAARAIAVYLLDKKVNCIDVYNRTTEKAQNLSNLINSFIPSLSFSDDLLFNHCNEYNCIINCSMKGQSGLIRDSKLNLYTFLEPYSAADFAYSYYTENEDIKTIIENSFRDIFRNNKNSFKWFSESHTCSHVFDAIHTPPETIMLKHARWNGKKTMNGKLMNVMQAVECFIKVFPNANKEEIKELMLKA